MGIGGRRRALPETYGVTAPRYTSDPTAVQFTPAVDACLAISAKRRALAV